MKCFYFDYVIMAERMGFTSSAACYWAMTEDVYRPDGELLGPDDTTAADGLCYHSTAHRETKKTVDNDLYQLCRACGQRLIEYDKNSYGYQRADPPGRRKIATHSEQMKELLEDKNYCRHKASSKGKEWLLYIADMPNAKNGG